jgi:hypothetical protein
MKINRESKAKTVKFGDLEPGDVFQPIWGKDIWGKEVYYMVIKRIFTNPERAVDLETGTLKVLHPEDDVIPFDAELTVRNKQ